MILTVIPGKRCVYSWVTKGEKYHAVSNGEDVAFFDNDKDLYTSTRQKLESDGFEVK